MEFKSDNSSGFFMVFLERRLPVGYNREQTWEIEIEIR